jgi:hypothetical protein
MECPAVNAQDDVGALWNHGAKNRFVLGLHAMPDRIELLGGLWHLEFDYFMAKPRLRPAKRIGRKSA